MVLTLTRLQGCYSYGLAFTGLTAFALLSGPGCDGRVESRPDAILVTIESLRADHVGAYGYSPAKTSALDDLARGGARFDQAIAQSCFTAPSLATLSTGLYPVEHGVLRWGDRGDGISVDTLAERLAQAGYRTACFSGHGALGNIAAFARGFETFEDEPDLPSVVIVERCLRWLKQSRRSAFGWLHLFETHAPYRPGERHGRPRAPRELVDRLASVPFVEWETKVISAPGGSFADRVAFLTSQYDGEIDIVDEGLGELVRGLREADRLNRTILIVTADHGENLGDHAPFFDHRDFLYDSLVRVPLIVFGPGIAPSVIETQARHVDVAPTLLDLLGEGPSSRGRSGESLATLLRLGGGIEDLPAFADSGRQSDPHQAVRQNGRKLMRRLSDGHEVMFDLAADSAEVRDVLAARAAEGRVLRDKLNRWIASMKASRADGFGFDSGSWERLRALGYVR